MNTIHLQFSIFLISLSLTISCTSNKKPSKDTPEYNQITLIFDSAPSNWKVYRKAGGYTPARCEIKYIDDQFIPKHYVPKTTTEFDTLIVKTKRKLVEFRHSYRGLDELSYIFQKGDTVLFSYQDKTPNARIVNRETKPYDVNLDFYRKNNLNPNDYPAYIKFTQSIFFFENSLDFRKEDSRIKNSAMNNIEFEVLKEKELLDSLKNHQLISDESYFLFSTKSNYQIKIMQLQSIIGAHSIKPLFNNLTYEDFNNQLSSQKDNESITFGNFLDVENDSLLYFGFYNDLTDWIYYNYLSRKVGQVKTTNYVNNISTAGSNIPDYLALYDTINDCNFISANIKDVLRLKAIQHIIENYSIDESQLVFHKFENDVKNSTFIDFVTKKYKLNQSEQDNSFDLQLTSTKAEYLSFSQLLEKHKGNVIYLDFWSSVCRPCIKEFEHAEKLKKLYKGKKVVQIYVSIEPDRNKWIKACEQYNLSKESYFVENRFTSRQLENLKIKYVPHYLIINKNGDFVNNFAPRPSENKTQILIDKYLNE